MILWAAVSFLICMVLLPVARSVAYNINFVDFPDGRKHHKQAIPPIGGVIIIPVFLILSFLSDTDFTTHTGFICSLLIVWGAGIIDDKVHLHVTEKLIIQTFAAGILVISNDTIIYNLGDLLGSGNIMTGSFAILFSMIAVVFLINAINMIDGLDGLCSGVVAIIIMALICALSLLSNTTFIAPMFCLLGGLFAFLFYNYFSSSRKKTGMFLGDSGSMSLGLILAWLVIELSQNQSFFSLELLNPVLIAWILSVPVFDALALTFYRLSIKKSPLQADRYHLHYLLHNQGLSKDQTTNFIHLIMLVYAVIGIIALVVFNVPSYIMMAIWVIFLGIHIAVTFGALNMVLRKIIYTD